MQPSSFLLSLLSGACLALAGLAGSATANAQSTAISYTGALNLNGAPFTGIAEFQFTLWDAATAGNQTADTEPDTMILGVTNGLFSTSIDFGAGAFTGADRWLQIQVRTNIGSFTTLAPRQSIASVPYAIRALNATATELPSGNYTNAVTLNNPGNLFAGNGSALTGLNAGNLASGTVADARITATVARTNQVWLLGGNAGINTNNHFIGTTDARPLEFRANGQRVFRMEAGGDSIDPDTEVDGAPNIIGGSRYNYVSNGVTGATISGGGAVNFNGLACSNRVSGDYGTIGGGAGNRAANTITTIGGGFLNQASDWASTVAGGQENTASGGQSVVAGGGSNTAGGTSSTVGGGFGNTATASGSTVGGGFDNHATGDSSVVAGGNHNDATGEASAIAGGSYQTATGENSTIGGGYSNDADGYTSTVGGGYGNAANGQSSTVSGGSDNTAGDLYDTVAGGVGNVASGKFSFAAGTHAMALHRGSFVWADGNGGGVINDFASTGADQFCIRARGGVRLNDLTSLHFGSATRQMLNLFGNNYGIGVQDSTLYFRSNDRFSWYRFGAHADNENNPGTAGSVLMTLTSGGLTVNGAFVNASDRNKKENFQSVDPTDVLAKVVALPISQWNYRDDEDRSRHLGPMAQDFHAAFGVGPDEKHIATVDADGVALAAIQGLNKKLEETSASDAARIQTLEAENEALEKRLADLETLVSKLSRH